MKVLIIRNYPTYLDVRNNTYNIQEVGLAKALVRKGNICDIVFWTDDKEEDVVLPVSDNTSVTVFYRKGINILKNAIYSKLDSMIQEYDIIQVCEYNQLYSWYVSAKYQKKMIVYHGTYYSKFNKRYNLMCLFFDLFFLKRYIKKDTKFLVKSELAKMFLENKGIDGNNITTVGVGMDVQMLQSDVTANQEIVYQKMIQQKQGPKILYVGRIEKRRNPFFILDVFEKIYVRNQDARLYIVGNGTEDHLNAFREYIKQKQLQDVVTWQQKMEQKYLSAVYEQADFFLLPTEYEIFGMVLLEAMYHKNIVLTTSNGGSSVLIEDGASGFILPELDSGKWSECILRLYGSDQYQEIADRAGETVKNYYVWDRVSDKFLNQYQKVIEGVDNENIIGQ